MTRSHWSVTLENKGLGFVHVDPSSGRLTWEVDDKASRTRAGRLKFARDLFLPEGYPESVRDGYLRFQVFDSVQALCSYFRGVVNTQITLTALGVGTSEATALAATTQWVLKDGAGMIGGLLFSWYAAQLFDLNTKKWRLFADVSNDLALTLEVFSPMICTAGDAMCFTWVMCVANVLKAMCGVSAGATRAVITAHFAKDNNIADVQAKEGSQETFVNLVGMLGGLWLTQFVGENQWSVWIIFVSLTVLHVYANYEAVKALRFPTLNGARLSLLISGYLSSNGKHAPKSIGIAAVNTNEPVLFEPKYQFEIGSPLPPIVDASSESFVKEKLSILEINPCTVVNSGEGSTLQVVMRSDASSVDIIAAIYHAIAHKNGLASIGSGFDFVDALRENGWDVDSKLALHDHKYRYNK